MGSTLPASGWMTHVKPVLWSALSNQYCNANWAADWAARTEEPLDSCKASCDADPSCPGITMGGANTCVKCSSVSSTAGAGGWTTHVKLAPAQTTTTATTTITTTAATTTVASTTLSTTSSAATTTTATTTA